MKISTLIKLLITIPSLALTSCGEKKNSDRQKPIAPNNEYLKSVTYFADEWPVNFWSSELNNVDSDFARIKEDGFNSIVICIPWREVQPTINPITYSDYFFDQLDKVMKSANEHDLYVVARAGYEWDYIDEGDSSRAKRFYDILSDTKTQKAWTKYLKTIYKTLKKYKSFIGAFICWEDFWANVHTAQRVSELSDSESVKYAKEMGYQDYIRRTYKLKDYSSKVGVNYRSYDEIGIPKSNKEEFRYFYDYFDNFLNSLLDKSRKVFPNLSMETRLDADLIQKDSGQEYYSHSITYKAGRSSYTCTMYGTPMGFENKGDKVHAPAAIRMAESILKNYNSVTDSKSLFIDQFIFRDNTPKFSYNTQIYDDEVNYYLENVGYVLATQSAGYAIWTYKNYLSNMLFNPQFALGTRGWSSNTNLEILQNNNNKFLHFTNGTISQQIKKGRNHFSENQDLIISFDCGVKEPTTLTITCNDQTRYLVVSPDCSNYQFHLNDSGFEKYDFSLTCPSEIYLDNIKCYSQVQDGKLYDNNWQPLENLTGIKILNNKIDDISRSLDNPSPLLSKIKILNFEEEDNPYNANCAVMNYSPISENPKEYIQPKKSVFITPGAQFEISKINIPKNGELKFDCSYHYLIDKSLSDGAGLDIDILNGSDHIHESLFISNTEEIARFSYKIPEKFCNKESIIKITCNGGPLNDNSADWLVISDLAII